METTTKSHGSSTSVALVLLSIAVGVVLVIQFSLWSLDAGHSMSLAETNDLFKKEFMALTELPFSHHDRLPVISDQKAVVDLPNSPDYYMVFSTSCSPQQNWESMVFFYHAMKVGQPGNVTRILSGCNENESKEAVKFFQEYIRPMSDRFHLHLTPNFSNVKKLRGKSSYKYMNKPYGLRHWMEHELGLTEGEPIDRKLSDSIVMLLDPDMILLRPLMHDFTREDVIFLEDKPATRVVKTGYPISQQDGYLNSAWMKRNFSYITGLPDGEYVVAPPWDDGRKHWNSGPPYLATVKDMFEIAVKWTEYAPRVLELYPDIFAEMVGFIMACVQLELPFTFIKSLVVSTTKTNDREGWAYIDSLPDEQVCSPGVSARLPVGLHYCKRYVLGEWFFSKYRMKKNIMNCDKGLMKPPPENMLYTDYDYGLFPPKADGAPDDSRERTSVGTKQAKREAFMLCALMNAVNEALRYHKQLKCGTTGNLEETYSIHQDPSNY